MKQQERNSNLVFGKINSIFQQHQILPISHLLSQVRHAVLASAAHTQVRHAKIVKLMLINGFQLLNRSYLIFRGILGKCSKYT